MAFDLSTARQYKPKGFDIGTARVPGSPRSPAETRPRAEVEAELAQRQAASAEADATNERMNTIDPLVRGTSQALTGLARGVAGLPAMAEQGIDAAIDLVPNRMTGQPMNRDLPRVFRAPIDALSPEELAPRNAAERFTGTAAELAGGALSGTGTGQAVAKTTSSPAAKAVGTALADMPGRQGIGAITGAAAGTAAHEAGANPLVEMLATTLGGGAAFVKAKPGTAFDAPAVPGARGAPTEVPITGDNPLINPAPAGRTVADVRSAGYPVAPSLAARAAQREAPIGEMPSVPGTFLESLVNKGELAGRMGTESAKVTEGIVRNELDLPEGIPVTRESLDLMRQPANAVYDRVAATLPVLDHTPAVTAALDQLGARTRANPYLQNNPVIEKLRMQLEGIQQAPTQQALDAIRQWRRDARIFFQSLDDPAKHDMAREYRSAANALEQGIEDQLAASGNRGLFEQFQQARTYLAKINNVLDAWSGNEVDPQALARLGEDTQLTGGLQQIANAAIHSPETVFSTTGTTITRPSNASWINTPESGLRRFLFERFVIPKLMSPEFQNQYGRVGQQLPTARPNLDPIQGPPLPPGGAPPPPDPPPGGRFPWSPAGEGPLSLAPDGGGVPFEGSQLPVEGPAGIDLAERMAPDMFGAAGIPDTGLTLPGPLDEMLGSGVGAERYPFSPTAADAPGLQPGASVGLADQLMPEPGPFGPDVSPTPSGPNDAGPYNQTGRPRAGGPDTAPGALALAPDNAHELPNGLADLMGASAQPSPVTGLPPALQAIADLAMGGNAQTGGGIDELAALMGLGGDSPAGPPRPMNPASGRKSLADVRSGLDETAAPTGQAEPDEFLSLGDLFSPPPGAKPKAVRVAKPKKAADELSLENGPARSEPPADFNAMESPLPEGSVKLGDANRSIVIKPFGDRMRIQQTDVAPEMQGKGLNRQNIKDALDHAQSKGMPLDSDQSFTTSAWKSWKSALDKGIFEGDVDRAAVEAAMEAGGGVAKNPSGEPWITNIRLGPKG